jgi:hypothetical protein
VNNLPNKSKNPKQKIKIKHKIIMNNKHNKKRKKKLKQKKITTKHHKRKRNLNNLNNNTKLSKETKLLPKNIKKI